MLFYALANTIEAETRKVGQSMDNKNMKNEQLFREAPVWKAIASLAVPSLLSILVMIFYNLADTFFIAQLGDTAKVAAVSIVSPVFSISRMIELN